MGLGRGFPSQAQNARLAWGTCSFQRTHVDYESILHVLPEHAVKCLVDLLDRDDFDFGHDIFLAAVVEHLLRLRHAANHRARDRCPLYDQAEDADGGWLFWKADQGDRSVLLQKREIRFESVRR